MKLMNNVAYDELYKAYSELKLDKTRKEYLDKAYKGHLPLSYFVNTNFSERQLSYIYNKLKIGVDVSEFAKGCYNVSQMEEIYLGIQIKLTL